MCLQADSEDSDQTGRTVTLLVLSCRGSIIKHEKAVQEGNYFVNNRIRGHATGSGMVLIIGIAMGDIFMALYIVCRVWYSH